MSELKSGVKSITVTDPSTPVHFFDGPGPMDVIKVTANTWKFRWYLDKVEGTTRARAKEELHRVLRDPNGWGRTGVRWVRTYDRAKANIIINFVPQDTSPCGPGSAGCYSWGGDKPQADIGVEYIDRPEMLDELINMEVCGHGTFRMTDMYQGTTHHPENYQGVMGTWEGTRLTGYMPSQQEIDSAKQWLRGETPPERIHND